MTKFFGTDGVRGLANTELTCELAMNIGRAAGSIFKENDKKNDKPMFLIGKDTRLSSDMLESALAAGLCSVGANVMLLGVIPTPGVATLVKKYNMTAGFMISASHNPMEYNGIKIFNKDGYKLPDEIEIKIENLIKSKQFNMVSGNQLGKIIKNHEAIDEYIDFIVSTVKGSDFGGLKIAVDCANGSAFATAKKLFSSLNIDYKIINDSPDGVNINKDCGSTYIKAISNFVKQNDFDVGIAFDGDADRCLIVDQNGDLIDGDKIIAIMAKYLKDKNMLNKNKCVVTVMSNLGLFEMAKANGIEIETTKVGDRYVLERMRQNGYSIGGEASGHIIMLDHSTTGDGELVAIHFLKIIKELHKKASELAKVMEVYPQILVNVLVSNKKKYMIESDEKVLEEKKKLELELGDSGRLLLRPSGTEPLIRVMVEGKDKEKIEKIAYKLAKVIKERFKSDEDSK